MAVCRRNDCSGLGNGRCGVADVDARVQRVLDEVDGLRQVRGLLDVGRESDDSAGLPGDHGDELRGRGGRRRDILGGEHG